MTDWKVCEIYEPLPAEDTPPPTAEGQKVMTIAQWAEDDRPRERLAAHGAEALSTAELLAILIGSGSKSETAVDLMKRLLADCGNSIAALSRKSVEELKHYNGIGEAKAVTIIAACELARRREQEKKPERETLDSPQKLYEHIRLSVRDLDVEEAFIILMNQRFRHIRTVRIAHGGMTETLVDVRVIMREALLANATVVALVHNHPSGNVRPSREDDNLTQRVKEACHTMRLHLLDHLVVTDGAYYSYCDEGRL